MSQDERYLVVFDCMIYLQAAISDKGPSAELLRLVEQGVFTLLVSREVLEEIRDIFSSPRIVDKNANLTAGFVESFLTRIFRTAQFIGRVPRYFLFSRDPKDEKYINLAIEGKADYLVSRDTDLLDLMTGYTDEAKEFRRRFRPLKVISPVEFLTLCKRA